MVALADLDSSDEAAPRPLRVDAQRNRARILEAAASVLATEGMSVPIDDVARRAGVGVGTVYRHFPTKQALSEAIVVDRAQRLVEGARAAADAGDPGAAFFGYLSEWVEAGAANKALSDAMADEGVDVKGATAAVKQDLHSALEELLTRAQRSGAVRDDVRIADLLVLLTGACLGINYADPAPRQRARMIAILGDGLRPSGNRLPSAASPRSRSRA